MRARLQAYRKHVVNSCLFTQPLPPAIYFSPSSIAHSECIHLNAEMAQREQSAFTHVLWCNIIQVRCMYTRANKRVHDNRWCTHAKPTWRGMYILYHSVCNGWRCVITCSAHYQWMHGLPALTVSVVGLLGLSCCCEEGSAVLSRPTSVYVQLICICILRMNICFTSPCTITGVQHGCGSYISRKCWQVIPICRINTSELNTCLLLWRRHSWMVSPVDSRTSFVFRFKSHSNMQWDCINGNIQTNITFITPSLVITINVFCNTK